MVAVIAGQPGINRKCVIEQVGIAPRSLDRITKEQRSRMMPVSNAFTCTGAYVVLVMSGW